MNRLSLEAAIGVTAVLALSQILPAGDLEPGPQPTILADEFAQAARDGDLTRARELIQRGIDIGCEDREGLTAIEAAQIAGQRSVQEYLVSLGADTRREPPPLKTWLSKWMFALTPEPSPGVAILVTQDGQVLFEDARGLASMEQQIPVSLATRFRIASVTKQFTAAAILKLQEERKLSVRDPVAKYVADYPDGELLTLHHLLTHTAGIVDYSSQQGFLERVGRPISPEALLNTFRTEPLEFRPGSDWKDSNSGYVLLGQIVEIVAGEPYSTFLKSRFFDPLGMNDTGVFATERGTPHETVGYGWSPNGYKMTRNWDMSHTGGAGTLYSTVGEVHLHLKGPTALCQGEPIEQIVDVRKRTLHAKAHTAGHLVAHVVEIATENLMAIKGYHFPDGPYVEFVGENGVELGCSIEQINQALEQAIMTCASIVTRSVTYDELREICPRIPHGLPTNMPLRVVRIGDHVPVPCGGTHLASLAEIARVLVTKMKSKKGNTRVSYSFS